MRNPVLSALSALLAVCMVAGASSAWAGFEEGWAAYKEDDYETAYREFHEAFEQGDVRGAGGIGHLYDEVGDREKAAEWFRKGAERGDAGSQFRLGWKYEMGEGLAENHAEAARWYHLAAEQGNKSAALQLAVMYMMGKGVPENETEAWKWRCVAEGEKLPNYC